jgi:hypothetical protein
MGETLRGDVAPDPTEVCCGNFGPAARAKRDVAISIYRAFPARRCYLFHMDGPRRGGSHAYIRRGRAPSPTSVALHRACSPTSRRKVGPRDARAGAAQPRPGESVGGERIGQRCLAARGSSPARGRSAEELLERATIRYTRTRRPQECRWSDLDPLALSVYGPRCKDQIPRSPAHLQARPSSA